jgi:hypothetical protein
MNSTYKNNKNNKNNKNKKNNNILKKMWIICNWCGKNHGSRECNEEKMVKTTLKLRVGSVMEEIVEKCIQCPNCLENNGFYCDNNLPYTFKRLDNNTPSLDLECQYCGVKVEVKSKCLSVEELPNNIFCKGGNYDMLTNRIFNDNLNLIIIIYSADRKTKNISIRQILWIDNYELKNRHNISIKENENHLSTININNINFIYKIKHQIKNISFSSYLQHRIF